VFSLPCRCVLVLLYSPTDAWLICWRYVAMTQWFFPGTSSHVLRHHTDNAPTIKAMFALALFSRQSPPALPISWSSTPKPTRPKRERYAQLGNADTLGFFCPTTFVSYTRRPRRHGPRVARNRGMYITSHQVVADKQLLRRQSWYFCTSKESKLSTCVGPRETARRHHHCPTEIAPPLPP